MQQHILSQPVAASWGRLPDRGQGHVNVQRPTPSRACPQARPSKRSRIITRTGADSTAGSPSGSQTQSYPRGGGRLLDSISGFTAGRSIEAEHDALMQGRLAQVGLGRPAAAAARHAPANESDAAVGGCCPERQGQSPGRQAQTLAQLNPRPERPPLLQTSLSDVIRAQSTAMGRPPDLQVSGSPMAMLGPIPGAVRQMAVHFCFSAHPGHVEHSGGGRLRGQSRAAGCTASQCVACVQANPPYLVPASAMSAAAQSWPPHLLLGTGQQPMPGLEIPRVRPGLAESLGMPRGKAPRALSVHITCCTSLPCHRRQQPDRCQQGACQTAVPQGHCCGRAAVSAAMRCCHMDTPSWTLRPRPTGLPAAAGCQPSFQDASFSSLASLGNLASLGTLPLADTQLQHQQIHSALLVSPCSLQHQEGKAFVQQPPARFSHAVAAASP